MRKEPLSQICMGQIGFLGALLTDTKKVAEDARSLIHQFFISQSPSYTSHTKGRPLYSFLSFSRSSLQINPVCLALYLGVKVLHSLSSITPFRIFSCGQNLLEQLKLGEVALFEVWPQECWLVSSKYNQLN